MFSYLRWFVFPSPGGESYSYLYDAVMVAQLLHLDGDCIPPNPPYHLVWYSHPDYGHSAPNLSCFALLGELLALQTNSSRDWGFSVVGFFLVQLCKIVMTSVALVSVIVDG